MSKITEIFDGWYYLALKQLQWEPENIKNMAKYRLDICKLCPHGGITCGKCGCLLDAKARSPESSCPVGKW